MKPAGLFQKSSPPGVQYGRLNFDRIEGEIEIEKGKILVQDLTFQSPAANAAVTGKTKSLIVYSLEVTGSLSDPRPPAPDYHAEVDHMTPAP